jgi:hypothetical protein
MLPESGGSLSSVFNAASLSSSLSWSCDKASARSPACSNKNSWVASAGSFFPRLAMMVAIRTMGVRLVRIFTMDTIVRLTVIKALTARTPIATFGSTCSSRLVRLVSTAPPSLGFVCCAAAAAMAADGLHTETDEMGQRWRVQAQRIEGPHHANRLPMIADGVKLVVAHNRTASGGSDGDPPSHSRALARPISPGEGGPPCYGLNVRF